MLGRNTLGPRAVANRRGAWIRGAAAVAVAALAAGCGLSGGNGGASATGLLPSGAASTGSTGSTPNAATAGGSRPAAPGPDAAHPCGVPGPSHYTHVVWIWMENKEYGSVIGSSAAPYENALAAQCGLAADYHGVTHPSLPNYLAATGGSTFAVSDDAGPGAHPIAGDSIFGQVAAAGLTWRSYEESMGSPCQLGSSGRYAVKHNPAAYFTAIRSQCQGSDVPLADAFGRDISAGTLPTFAFVTPDLCSDTHNCPVGTGDAWLATWVRALLDGPNYRAGTTLVVVTWDEGVGSANTMPTIVVAPTVASGTVARVRLDHYSLLATTEDVLALPRLGSAQGAVSMVAAFGL